MNWYSTALNHIKQLHYFSQNIFLIVFTYGLQSFSDAGPVHDAFTAIDSAMNTAGDAIGGVMVDAVKSARG